MAKLRKLDPKTALKKYQMISDADNAQYSTWKERCRDNVRFFMSDQWSKSEIDTNADRGQYTLTINKIRKAVKGMLGIFAATQPKYKVVAAEGSHENVAALTNKLLDWAWQNSGGVHTFRSIVKAALVSNMGYFHVLYSKDNKVKFIPLTFEEVLVDAKSKDPLFKDADFIAIEKYMPVESVKAIYGVDTMMLDTPPAWTSSYSDQNLQAFLGRIFSDNKQYVKIYEVYKKSYVKRTDGFVDTQIIRETMLGYEHVFTETLPGTITEYPIVPLFVEDTGNPYKLGEVYFMKPLQRFINKSYGVVLMNAQLTSNPKIFLKETDIPTMDRGSFEDNMAKPGSLNILTPMANPPVVVNGQPLNSAFFTLYQDAKSEFEQATLPMDIQGYGEHKSGNHNSYLLDMKESVLDSFKDFTGNIDLACEHLARILLQYCKTYLTDERIIQVINKEGVLERIELNKQKGIDFSNAQTIEAFKQQQMQAGVKPEDIQYALEMAADDSDMAAGISVLVNGILDLDVDLYVIPASYAPTYEMAMLRLFLELFEAGAVDNQAVLEHSPLEDKQKIIDRYNELKMLKEQLENKNLDVQYLSQQLKAREAQMTNLKIQTTVERESVKMDRMKAEQKLKNLRDKYQGKLASKEMLQELELKIKEILLEAKYELKEEGAIEKPSANDVILDMLNS